MARRAILIGGLSALAACALFALWRAGGAGDTSASDGLERGSSGEARAAPASGSDGVLPAPDRPAPNHHAEPSEPAAVAEADAPPKAGQATRSEVRPLELLRGRVVDEESGAGLADCGLSLVLEEQQVARTQSDETGAFELRARSGPVYALRVEPPEGWVAREPEVLMRGGSSGPAVLVVVRRWPPPPAGDVRGFLRSEGGEWDVAELERDAIVLDLVLVSDPSVSLRARIAPSLAEDGAAELAFAFEEVPRGEYELSLSSLGNHRWHPTTMFVSPPAENLEFLRYDEDESGPVSFLVIDAETDEPVTGFEVFRLEQSVSLASGTLLHTGPFALDDVPLHGSFRWALVADGYAAAFGDERSFRDPVSLEEGPGRVAEVRLRRGFSARFVVVGRDPFMRPLPGAIVSADGARLGRTGADGALQVQLDGQPDSVEVRYRDWALSNDPFAARQGMSMARRGYVIPLVLEPPE